MSKRLKKTCVVLKQNSEFNDASEDDHDDKNNDAQVYVWVNLVNVRLFYVIQPK